MLSLSIIQILIKEHIRYLSTKVCGVVSRLVVFTACLSRSEEPSGVAGDLMRVEKGQVKVYMPEVTIFYSHADIHVKIKLKIKCLM